MCITVGTKDVLARHMRLRTGAAVLLAGLDHAGIATQVCVVLFVCLFVFVVVFVFVFVFVFVVVVMFVVVFLVVVVFVFVVVFVCVFVFVFVFVCVRECSWLRSVRLCVCLLLPPHVHFARVCVSSHSFPHRS